MPPMRLAAFGFPLPASSRSQAARRIRRPQELPRQCEVPEARETSTARITTTMSTMIAHPIAFPQDCTLVAVSETTPRRDGSQRQGGFAVLTGTAPSTTIGARCAAVGGGMGWDGNRRHHGGYQQHVHSIGCYAAPSANSTPFAGLRTIRASFAVRLDGGGCPCDIVTDRAIRGVGLSRCAGRSRSGLLTSLCEIVDESSPARLR